MATTLHIQLLGGFQATLDGTPLTGFNSPRVQALLGYLVLNRKAPQPRSLLASLFWPDLNDLQALANLRNLLFQLRQALPCAERFLQTNKHTIKWRSDAPFTADVIQFESALSRAESARREGEFDAQLRALEEAVSLYAGTLLPHCNSEWLPLTREQLYQQHRQALQTLVTLLERHRNYRAAIRYAQRLLRDEPLQESTCLLLMRLHTAAGDRAEALRVYRVCANVLRRELGIEPNTTIREAYDRLLRA